MIYFYCQSYQAFNMALSLSLSERVVVITSVDNIIKACNFLGLEFIVHRKFTINDYVLNSKLVKNEIKILVNKIADNEFHFSHTQFAVFNFILVKALNDTGRKTVFHNFEFVYNAPSFKAWRNVNFIRLQTYLLLLNLLYGKFLTIRMSTVSSFMLSLKIDYISKSCYKVIDNKMDYYDITLKMFKDFKFEYPEIKNLFIAQTFNNELFFNSDKINELLPILNDPSISIKNHPKLGKIKELNNCIELPDFLPVELFFQKVTNCIISIHSSSLITASKLNNAKTVSLLDIVKTSDPFLDQAKNDLKLKSNNSILFPKNIAQLKPILSENES